VIARSAGSYTALFRRRLSGWANDYKYPQQTPATGDGMSRNERTTGASDGSSAADRRTALKFGGALAASGIAGGSGVSAAAAGQDAGPRAGNALRESVAEMTRDQLTAEQKTGPHADIFFQGHSGWGLGMAVALRRDRPWLTPGRFGWDGGYGTSAYTDPRKGLIGVLMTQRMMDSPEPPVTYIDFWTAAYARA
jgi:CubicO group peptidase (beta-lactamase class C family)